jgi:hypothetical protein
LWTRNPCRRAAANLHLRLRDVRHRLVWTEEVWKWLLQRLFHNMRR